MLCPPLALQDRGGLISLDQYTRLPPEQYNELDPAMIKALGGSSFLLKVPRLTVRRILFYNAFCNYPAEEERCLLIQFCNLPLQVGLADPLLNWPMSFPPPVCSCSMCGWNRR
jgi:hypothetical protein